MTKNEFMKELRTYLIYEQASLRNEILSDYETYFAMAAATGVREEDVVRSLDTPSHIASLLYGKEIHRPASGISIRAVTSSLMPWVRRTGGKMISLMPSVLSFIRGAASLLFRWSGVLAALLVLTAAAAVLYFTASGFQLLPSISPIPVMSPLSLLTFSISGVCFSLFFLYAGQHLSRLTRTSVHFPVLTEKED